MINNVTIMGRLTADPELRTTNNGTSVTSFAVAVDRKYTPTGQEKQTDFIDCVAWKSKAEFITRYFHKGDMIAIEGELQTRTYEDKHGNKRKAVEVLANNVSFCGYKKEEKTVYDEGQPSIDINEDDVENGFVVVDDSEINDDDLPF
jgi:single-strand DNA-binding protein